MQNQFLADLFSFCCQNKKTLGFIILLCILLLFGDTLLPIIGHFLHVLSEIFESILEHFLEATFGMTERQAQITLFYGAFTIVALTSYYIARKTWFAMCELVVVSKAQWLVIKNTPWFKSLLVFFAIGTTFYLFS